MGGGSIDPKTNLQLAAALKKAKDQGVPRENIEKAIAKVTRDFFKLQLLDSHVRQASHPKEKGGSPVSYEALAFNTVGVIM